MADCRYTCDASIDRCMYYTLHIMHSLARPPYVRSRPRRLYKIPLSPPASRSVKNGGSQSVTVGHPGKSGWVHGQICMKKTLVCKSSRPPSVVKTHATIIHRCVGRCTPAGRQYCVCACVHGRAVMATCAFGSGSNSPPVDVLDAWHGMAGGLAGCTSQSSRPHRTTPHRS